jgi:hypothetical protein
MESAAEYADHITPWKINRMGCVEDMSEIYSITGGSVTVSPKTMDTVVAENSSKWEFTEGYFISKQAPQHKKIQFDGLFMSLKGDGKEAEIFEGKSFHKFQASPGLVQVMAQSNQFKYRNGKVVRTLTLGCGHQTEDNPKVDLDAISKWVIPGERDVRQLFSPLHPQCFVTLRVPDVNKMCS